MKDRTSKEKMRRQRRNVPPGLLIKPTEGKTFAKIIGKIRYTMKPEDSEAEVSSIRKMNDGRILVELGPRATDKGMFCQVVKRLMGEKALISRLDATAKNNVEDAIKSGSGLASPLGVFRAVREEVY